MVPTALVAPNIPGGDCLLHILPQFGLTVVDAFWYQSPSLGRWRLLLSLIEWDHLGPLASYEALQHALATVRELNMPLEDIVLTRPSDQRVERLRNTLPGGVWEQPYSDVVLFQESMEADRTMAPVYVYALKANARRLGVAI